MSGRVGVEYPKPGNDGTITSKASAGSPPNAAGSASRSMTFDQCQNVQGHPWLQISGVGSGPIVIAPNGSIAARYRKMFPWLPYEQGIAAGGVLRVRHPGGWPVRPGHLIRHVVPGSHPPAGLDGG
jgi:hypothetical protein